jgi:hypothetical protein
MKANRYEHVTLDNGEELTLRLIDDDDGSLKGWEVEANEHAATADEDWTETFRLLWIERGAIRKRVMLRAKTLEIYSWPIDAEAPRRIA